MYTDDKLTLEEADNRIICHIGHMIKADNLTSIKVRSADTDVIVILLEFMPQFKLWNDHIIIWFDFVDFMDRMIDPLICIMYLYITILSLNCTNITNLARVRLYHCVLS